MAKKNERKVINLFNDPTKAYLKRSEIRDAKRK